MGVPLLFVILTDVRMSRSPILATQLNYVRRLSIGVGITSSIECQLILEDLIKWVFFWILSTCSIYLN